MRNLEDLGLDGLKVYQDDELYRFTSDAVLLTKFASVKKGDVVADFCSGSGIVGFHLYGLNKNLIESVTLVEMQKPLFELSVESIKYNRLEDKFFALNLKVQDIPSVYAGKFSLIVCNPPYMPVGHGFYEEDRTIAVCRTEIELSFSELATAISRALKFGGRVSMVHRADRLVEIVSELKKNNIETKRLQFVSGGDKEPYLVLLEGVKGGKSGVKILKNLTN